MKWTKKGHELDAVAERLARKKHIYIYGAGENGKYTYDRLKFLPLEEIGGSLCFIDADPAKRESGYLSRKVVSLKEALDGSAEERLIILAVSDMNRPNVSKIMTVHGLKEGEDFVDHLYFIDICLPVYAAYRFNKVYHRGMSFVPTRKCVLNCQHCLNFIPYVKTPTDDALESMKADLDRLFACVDYTGILSIVGGEIFLHPQHKELFRYVGEHFRNQIATLSITTSAALMPDDETFEIFKEYGFTVHVSDYRSALPGLSEKYARFVEKLEQYQVDYVLIEDHQWIDLDAFREQEMFTTEEEAINWFDICGIPWSYYKDGKLWQCNWAGFAVMAGAKEPCETDYYDLTSCTTEKVDENGQKHFVFQGDKCRELMEFGVGYSERGYVEMCKKCNGYTTINHHFVPPAVQIPRKK